ETLLSAAILEVNTSALNLSGPALNVLTPDVGGTYNPYATGAPVTIYATGIRNAFTLFFDNTGQLWAPANGSSSGGNTPAGGGAPALTNVQQVEEDQLFKVVKGAYYGHPDPARNQFVLDQGNPSSGAIAGLAFTAYPAGTASDPNYHLPNYIFGLHSSPDGMIEYEGSAFNGTLAGKFLVAEYSGPDDIAVLSVDSTDNIIGGLVSTAQGIGAEHGVSGLFDLNSPVSLVEDNNTGFIYVSELGANKITLLEPSSVAQQITPSATNLAFNTIATGNPGAAASRTETVTITNTGADQLTFSSIGIINDPNAAPAASTFTITNSSSIPTSLNSVGVAFTFQITYTASLVGLQSAILQIKSNDPVTPTLDITLHGIGTAGQYGSLEPSLVQVLRAFNIPTIVGAGPDDANINTVPYPITPDASSQEVDMQRMVAATSGPVTITPLASFSTATSPVSDIGYYTPGNPSATTQLFDIAMADSQTLNPTAVGSTSFNPGTTPFGLYALFPGVSTPNSAPDQHYSEDSLNTPLDPNNPRKIRFFPYETSDGTVVPNTFVFAVEDYNDATVYNSFVNFVGIISNVAGAPPVPANLTVASNNSAGVTLTWDASPGATSYNLQRMAPGSSTFTTVATGLTTPTYTDTDVADGATYEYEVQAVNAVDDSAFSTAVSVMRQTGTVTSMVPDPPTNLQVTSHTSTGVGLSWTAASTATSYVVERSSTGAGGFSEIATGITTTTYADSNVVQGETYQYEIFSQNDAGLSNTPSGVVSATIPPPPQTLSVTVGKGSNKSVQFFDDAGTLTTIKLNGMGTATVNFGATTISQASGKTGVVVSGTDITLASISTTGTGIGNSVLAITTRGGPNSISVGSITIDASLNAINAPTTALVGPLSVTGSINRLSLGSVNGSTVNVGGGVGTLKIPSVTGLALTSAGAIKNINATTWMSSQPINAPSIGTITINGTAQLDLATAAVRAIHVKGVLQNSTFALSGGGIQDLAMLSAGAISNTDIDAAGNLGSITAGALDNSQILAGTGISAATAFPPVSAFPAAATIAAVHLKKIKGAMSMVNSSIAASRINTLALANVQFSNNGVSFGVEANAIASLSSVNSANGKPFTLTKLTSADVVTTELSAKGVSAQDFKIDIV
ncbi:MAG TPA: fibronectin type III domain-containing protein, partial [Tepidisphaeraceae bacterium]|nr:fibronectin type III domain-containing protein [Tepidisphaeraceae bacterium]